MYQRLCHYKVIVDHRIICQVIKIVITVSSFYILISCMRKICRMPVGFLEALKGLVVCFHSLLLAQMCQSCLQKFFVIVTRQLDRILKEMSKMYPCEKDQKAVLLFKKFASVSGSCLYGTGWVPNFSSAINSRTS